MGSAKDPRGTGHQLVWCLEREEDYWRTYCAGQGMSTEEFDARWPVVSLAYRIALDHPRESVEEALRRFLRDTNGSGLDEDSRRQAFGRIWGRILARQHGDLPPGTTLEAAPPGSSAVE